MSIGIIYLSDQHISFCAPVTCNNVSTTETKTLKQGQIQTEKCHVLNLTNGPFAICSCTTHILFPIKRYHLYLEKSIVATWSRVVGGAWRVVSDGNLSLIGSDAQRVIWVLG